MRNLLIATILTIFSSSYWLMGTETDNQQYQSIQPIQAELDKKIAVTQQFTIELLQSEEIESPLAFNQDFLTIENVNYRLDSVTLNNTQTNLPFIHNDNYPLQTFNL